MIRIKQLVFVVSLGISSFVFGQMANVPRIVVINPRVDFGVINEDGGTVSHTFKYVNIGKKPLKIINVLTSCGCTTPDWTRTEVQSGDTGFVTAVFNPKGKDGFFSKSLTIMSNGDPQSANLTIEGTVYSANSQMAALFPVKSGNMLLSSSILELPAQKENKEDTVWLGVFNATDQLMFIDMIVTPVMMKTNAERMVLKPREGDNIMFTYNGRLSKGLGTHIDSIWLSTSDKSETNKLITVKAKIVQNFDSLTPQQLANAPQVTVKQTDGNVGELYQGEVGTFTYEITNTGKSDLVVRKVLSDCKCIQSIIPKAPIKKGAKGKVIVSYDTKGKHLHAEEKLILITNDPKNPETFLKIRAKVVIPGKEPFTH